MIEGLGSGGAERLLFTNLKHFERERLQNVVLTVYHQHDFWKRPIEELGVEVLSLNCKRISRILFALPSLLRIIRVTQPDVIHTHLWAANILGRIAGRFAGVPVISSVHNPEYEPDVVSHSSRIVKLKVATARVIDKWTARIGCRQMIAVSEDSKESVVRNLGYPVRRIETLYNPIDTFGIEPQKTRTQIFDGLNVKGDGPVLLTVGRVSPQKGLLYAVRAMSLIVRAFPDAHLVSIGACNDERYLAIIQDEIANLSLTESVHILGEQRDVTEYLGICDIFLFPSLFEGLGIALAEAMAAGCTCVVSRIRPITEYVLDGTNGIAVPPCDPLQLANAVIDTLANPRKREVLGRNALKTAAGLFQPRPAADRLTSIYFSVVSRQNT